MIKRCLITLLVLVPSWSVFGQLTGNNLFEYQLGNLPYTEPNDLSSHYNQLNLGYRYKGLKATMRYEHFLSQNEAGSYFSLSQFQVQYRKEKLELKVGNFNETLGNGLLVRGYEISGSVFEEEAYRSRYGFYRDMLGFSAKYSGDIWYFQALRGKSLVNTLPPTLSLEDRRIDLVEGMETGISLYYQTLGLILMRNSNPFEKDYFYSMLFSGSLPGIISYNFEYAHNLASDLPVLAMDDMSRFGMYGSLSFNLGSFGLSFEYKNYHNLLIGTGISDPPTTVREHKYKVLNRSIHVPQLIDESGIQLEGYYTFSNHEHLVINYTRSLNEFFQVFVFNEMFLEYSFYPGRKNNLTLFADYASDEFKSENARYTTGAVWDYSVIGTWSTQLHLEYQFIEREFAEKTTMHNGVVILGFTKSPGLSVSMVWEMTNDPFLTDRPDTPCVETTFRHYPGVEASYRINPTNTISIFAGKRRGGPA
ncbi:MAG: hypothetical protein KAT15_16070, partial [Bacteroidales bacterium]|nr:hypothetical protein [Bacteroidales bacterium]